MALRKTLWLIPLLAAVGLMARDMNAQVLSGGNQSKVIGRATTGANYFTIMGHIKYPNTYQLPTARPSLADFIKFAGGVLESTDGNLRIVRGGRVVQNAFLTSIGSVQLMAGDIVIVTGGRTGRGAIFRGNDNGAGEKEEKWLQVALVGVLDHTVLMKLTPQVATREWIVRQLGQEPAVANLVRVSGARRFAGANAPSKLSDNSVLVFPSGAIDPSRLPPSLPRPFVAGRDRHPGQRPAQAPPQHTPHNSAAPQIPLPLTQTAPDSAPATPPGHSAVPNVEEPDTPITDPETTRDMLTHPGSVALDERPGSTPGRAFVSDSGAASVGRPDNRTAPVRSSPPENDPDVNYNADVVEEAEAASSPEAAKPFTSQPDGALTPVRPESTIEKEADTTTALPLSPLRPETTTTEPPHGQTSIRHSAPKVETPEPTTAAPAISPSVEIMPPPAEAPSRTPEPTASIPARPDATVAKPASPASPRVSSLPPTIEPTSTASRESSHRDEYIQVDAAQAGLLPGGSGESRIIRRNGDDTNWPLIAAGVIGSLGFLAAFSLLLSMTGPGPKTVEPQPKSDRVWLDAIINDELPVEEEEPAEPAVSELFGRPTDAPIIRIDAEQHEVPRPHFLDRGDQTGVAQPRAPQPDMPEPDSKNPDGDGDIPVVPPRTPRNPPTRTPDVPMAPAAESQTAVAEASVATPQKKRIIRMDTGHGSSVPSKKPAGRPHLSVSLTSEAESPTISVKPARSVVEGADLLDRVLATVEFEKKASRPESQS